MRKSTLEKLLFSLLILSCLAQVVWWTWVLVQTTAEAEVAAQHLRSGDSQSALSALGADASGSNSAAVHRRRVMFISEGVALTCLILTGIVWFYLNLRRERRLQHAHERFLTGATHELKTPLATLRLGLESLQTGRHPPAHTAEYANAMLDQVDRLEHDVSNLLTTAQLHDKAALEPAAVGNLADDLRASLARIEPRARAATLHLTTDLPEVVTRRDARALRMAVHNLLDNAVKFTPAGGEIRVTLSADQNMAHIDVADTGIGIDQKDLPQVFDRFFVGTNGQHAGGTGLGLHIARELSVNQGGRLVATSAGIGRGSQFRLSLPLLGSA